MHLAPTYSMYYNVSAQYVGTVCSMRRTLANVKVHNIGLWAWTAHSPVQPPLSAKGSLACSEKL